MRGQRQIMSARKAVDRKTDSHIPIGGNLLLACLYLPHELRGVRRCYIPAETDGRRIVFEFFMKIGVVFFFLLRA